MNEERNKKVQDILGNITSNDAISILRIILQRHKELTDEICKIATELLSNVNSEDIAVDVANVLDSIQVEELWDRSGATSHGYSDPSEEAGIMFEEALESFIYEMKKYQKMGLAKEAKNYCIGIIMGIKKYEETSSSEFKDWAVDVPFEYIDTIFEKWMAGKPCQSDIEEVKYNKETLDAIQEAENIANSNQSRFSTIVEMFKDLEV